jgi:hypothetical protein
MKIYSKLALVAVAIAGGAVPALAAGPTTATAQKQCHQERMAMGKHAFVQAYGTNKDRRNAFGKCVSHRTAQDAADLHSALQNAPQTCRAQQNDPNFSATHGGEMFAQFYGTNGNDANAFGMCVSSVARAETAQSETSQVNAEDNAAKQCRAEQQTDPVAFKDKYGTNVNKSNAFGKCVSSKAKAHEGSGS